MGYVQRQTDTHTGCGWWPKRVLWVKDEKEHFALDSNVFVVMPGLPTVPCHDSCPPIQSHQSSISTPPWLSFKSQHHAVLAWKKQCKFEKIFVAMGCRSFWLSRLTLCYVCILNTHIMSWRWHNICQQTACTGTFDCFSVLPTEDAVSVLWHLIHPGISSSEVTLCQTF